MFTGLIEDIGSVAGVSRKSGGMELSLQTALPMEEIALGDSIAVNGICLTVTRFGSGRFTVDVSPESLDRTNLGALAVGTRVNLERALRLGDRLGGHLVSGHIDCQATIASRRDLGNAVVFSFAMEARPLRYVVEKGSVTIDGISLTVNEVTSDGFSVAIIPHTLALTTLQHKAVGSKVNIETDLIGKYVERLLQGGSEPASKGGGIDMESLAKNGFL